MNLAYFVTNSENSRIKNDDGIDLYVRDIAIHDQDRREGKGLFVIENWQIIFTLDQEKELVKEQSLIAEKTILQVNKYINCYQLMKLRADIANKQLQGIGNEEELKNEMFEVQNKLRESDKEYKTVLSVMTSHNVGIDDMSVEWIAENMINTELLYQDFQDSLLIEEINQELVNNFKLTHHYDIGDRSLYFSFDQKTIDEKAVDLAVYLQFKAETLFDDSICLDHVPIMQFLELFGAKQLNEAPQEFNTIDMYSDREYRCGEWYNTTYMELDKKIGEKTKEFLQSKVDEHGFKNQLAFLLNNHLNVFGINDILENDSEITDIAINRPSEFWYNKTNKWVKVDKESITFCQLMDFANHFAKYNDLEINADNPLCNGVMPSGNNCQVVIPPSVEHNTVAILISIK
ncbi:MAG: hypothetical protein AB7V48_16325 [Sedimentibacter sp.]